MARKRKPMVAGATAMMRRLKKERKLVGQRRDALRDLIDEYEGLFESCDRAETSIQDAIDALVDALSELA